MASKFNRLCATCNGTGVEPLGGSSNLDILKRALRELRIKDGCDYAITHKYEEYHLVCHDVWADTIKRIARECEVSFMVVYTYF